MVVALLRKSRFAIVRGIISIYISIMRGTPLMLQLLAWYFGPYYLFGINIGNWRFPALIIGFVVNYAAYFAEIYRGGIESIPVGQYEAAEVLGYTKSQTFMRIILPQVVKIIMPSVTNEVITLVKDTSLVRVIAVYELIWMGETFIKKGFIWPLFYTAVFYLVVTAILTLLLNYAEKKLDYFKV
jgi:His/Glu/Gln/Arg/opine family amino acid ABC transporter permease subunit